MASYEFCVWFSFARLPSEAARVFFLSHFLKLEMALFFFLLFVPIQCLNKTFLDLIFRPVTQYIIQILKTFRHFKTQKKIFVMMTPIVRLSSNRPIKVRECALLY